MLELPREASFAFTTGCPMTETAASAEVRDPPITHAKKRPLALPTWPPSDSATRIHGELLKLGIEVSQTTVAKYLVRERKPPSQTWRTFLENHATDIIATDFFTVPTATFRVHFVLVVLSHDRREILHTNVTESPTVQQPEESAMAA